MLTGYLAAPKLEKDLRQEIALHLDLRIVSEMGPLFLVSGPPRPLMWSHWVLSHLQKHDFDSITQAAQFLKSRGKVLAPCFAIFAFLEPN